MRTITCPVPGFFAYLTFIPRLFVPASFLFQIWRVFNFSFHSLFHTDIPFYLHLGVFLWIPTQKWFFSWFSNIQQWGGGLRFFGCVGGFHIIWESTGIDASAGSEGGWFFGVHSVSGFSLWIIYLPLLLFWIELYFFVERYDIISPVTMMQVNT